MVSVSCRQRNVVAIHAQIQRITIYFTIAMLAIAKIEMSMT